MDVIIAGGGTGGHLFPGVAVAEEIRRRDPSARILFVGTERGIEARAVPKAGFELALLPVSGLRRMGIWGVLRALFRLPFALWRASALVSRFKPQVAVSVGGYAAGPAVLAARLMGVPCVVMEQNAVPGLTNRILGWMARRVVAALPTKGFAPDKTTVLGNPVRADFLPIREVGYSPQQPLRLLVFGGSQGARPLNEAMVQLATQLASGKLPLRVVHQTGQFDYERIRSAYAAAGARDVVVKPFIDDMSAALGAADLVLCRAGATTIAELTVCGRPAILVPFPQSAGDHQTANALTLERMGAAVHIAQTELNSDRLASLLTQLASDPDRLASMALSARQAGHPRAAQDIVDVLMKEARGV